MRPTARPRRPKVSIAPSVTTDYAAVQRPGHSSTNVAPRRMHSRGCPSCPRAGGQGPTGNNPPRNAKRTRFHQAVAFRIDLVRVHRVQPGPRN